MFSSRNLAMTAFTMAIVLAAGGLAALAGEEPKPAQAPVKIGIVPFDDATGDSANAATGVVKWLRAEMVLDKRLLPKILTAPAEGAEPMDRERAVALGKQAGVDAVLMGTILLAEVETSQSSTQGPSVMGVGVGAGLSSARAEVTLQGELINVATGEVLLTERVTGKRTESKLRGDVQTQLGGLNFEDQAAQNSPLGKALKEAVQKLVRAVAKKMTPANANPEAKKPQKEN